MVMMKISFKFIIAFVLCFQLAAIEGFAQQGDVPPPSGTRKQIATIVYSGLAGAVLGLSTLSFYGRPQDRLSNIAVGMALGIIVGAVFQTYGATTDPDKFYGRELSASFDLKKNLYSDFEMQSRFQRKLNQQGTIRLDVPLLNYSF